MASSKSKNAARLRAGTPVLITESVDEFVALRKQLYDEIRPDGIIEQGWVDDLACVMWEIMRLLRIRAEILNGAFFKALTKILKQVLSKDNFENWVAYERAAEELARRGLRTIPMQGPRSPSCSANTSWTRPRSRHRRFACAPRISKN
jgi:hypothetical protein